MKLGSATKASLMGGVDELGDGDWHRDTIDTRYKTDN